MMLFGVWKDASQDEAGRKADSEMHAQKRSFWCRCSQRKREPGTAIEPLWNRLDWGSSAVKEEAV
jgi:hypothetical protein